MDSEAAVKIAESLSRAAAGALTELAAIRIPGPGDEDADSPLDFADHLAQILTHVAADAGGLDRLLAGRSGSWEADLIRQLVDGTVPAGRLHTWRTQPIRVAPINGENLLAENLAPCDQALTALEEAYNAAWNAAVDESTDPAVITWRQTPGSKFDFILGPNDPRWAEFQDWNAQAKTFDHVVNAHPTVAPIEAKLSAATEARAAAIAEYEKSFYAAMTARARTLGYTVDVVACDGSTEDLDWDLINDLEDVAMATTAKPNLTPPTN